MKTYILRLASISLLVMGTSLSVSAQSTAAEISDFFQQGETTNIGDSIKGKMITFNVEGTLNALEIENPTLPQKCRVVLQDNKVAWFENLFPARSKVHYHKWLKGALVNDANVYNPDTKKFEERDALVIFPFSNIDYMDWVKDDTKYNCNLNIRRVFPGALPNISFDDQYQDMGLQDFYIVFLMDDKNTLTCESTFGEIRTDYATTYNYNVTDPYGIDLDKLEYTEIKGLNGGVAYITGLILTPATGK